MTASAATSGSSSARRSLFWARWRSPSPSALRGGFPRGCPRRVSRIEDRSHPAVERVARMRYMLLMCRDEERWSALSPQERVDAYEEAFRYSDELRTRGVYETGNPLEPSSTATTVRLVQAPLQTTHAPFPHT